MKHCACLDAATRVIDAAIIAEQIRWWQDQQVGPCEAWAALGQFTDMFWRPSWSDVVRVMLRWMLAQRGAVDLPRAA